MFTQFANMVFINENSEIFIIFNFRLLKNTKFRYDLIFIQPETINSFTHYLLYKRFFILNVCTWQKIHKFADLTLCFSIQRKEHIRNKMENFSFPLLHIVKVVM